MSARPTVARSRRPPSEHRPSPEQRGDRLLEQLLLAHVELALHDETAFPMWNGREPDYQACVVAIRGADRDPRP